MPYALRLETLTGEALSELAGATGKRVSVAVNAAGASAVTVPGASEDADRLLEGDALLAAYYVAEDDPDDRTLLAHHRLVTAEEVAGEDSVSVAATFADPTWTLGRRLIGRAAGGYSRGTPLALVDRGTIIRELVDAANAESVTGVRMGTVAASSSTYVAGWYYKPLAEAIAELCAPLDGPDWRVRPIPYAGGYIGELDVVPSMATRRPDAAFEYGEGLLNVRSFRRGVSLEGTVNRVYSLPQGFPDNAVGAVLTAADATSRQARGLLEALVPSDLPVDAFRQGLLDQHIAVRKGPRQVFTFEPVRDLGTRVPRLGRDYNVGDVVPFRATIRRGAELVKRVDVEVRVYAVDVTVDEQGYGTPTLTVTPT